MPVAMVYTLARKSGQPAREVERYWQEAKAAAKEQFSRKSEDEFGDREWSYVTGIVLRRLGLKKSAEEARQPLTRAQQMIEAVLTGSDAGALLEQYEQELHEVGPLAAGVGGYLAAGLGAVAAGATLGTALPLGVLAGAATVWIRNRLERRKYQALIKDAAQQYGRDPKAVAMIFQQEANRKGVRYTGQEPDARESDWLAAAWIRTVEQLKKEQKEAPKKPVEEPAAPAAGAAAAAPAVSAPVVPPVAPQA